MKLPLPSTLTPGARVIALDVGGTSVKSALVAPGGCVIGESAITRIDSSGGAEGILGTFAQIIRTHLGQAQISNVIGVALGFPGPFDYAAGICLIQGVEKYGAIYGVDMRAALRLRLDLGDLSILFLHDGRLCIVAKKRQRVSRDNHGVVGST